MKLSYYDMGKMRDSHLVLPSFGIGLVAAAILTGFNLFSCYDHIWVVVAIVAILGLIAVLVGKTKELNWIDVGAPFGIFTGLLICYVIRMVLLS